MHDDQNEESIKQNVSSPHITSRFGGRRIQTKFTHGEGFIHSLKRDTRHTVPYIGPVLQVMEDKGYINTHKVVTMLYEMIQYIQKDTWYTTMEIITMA